MTKQTRKFKKNDFLQSKNQLIALLLIVFFGICCEAGASNPYVEKMLSADNSRDFNEALIVYGTLQGEDLPDVVKAVESSSPIRRKNGATLLNLCRLDECEAERVNAVRKTNDEKVWAILVERAAETDEKILREKPELLKKALESNDGELVAPALRVGLKIDYPGIRETVLKMLDSKNEKILEVVLNNLSPAMAKQEAARLARMLADEKTYGNVDMEIALALVRADDPQYYPNIKNFIERLKKNKNDHSFFNEAVFSEDKQMVDLLWKIAEMKNGDVLAEFRAQAYDALCRRVWAPDMREPASVELLELTLGYLKTASLDTNPRAHINDEHYGAESALWLIAYLNKGDTEHESFLYGKDAVAFTEKWLVEHRTKIENK